MAQTPNALVEIATRHQVHLEQLKAGGEKAFDKFLRQMQKDVIAQLSEVDDMESLRGGRLQRLLKAIRETLKAGFDDYEEVWRDQLKDLAEYESGFEARALKEVFGVDFDLPSPEQVITAAYSRPLSVEGPYQGSLLASFYDGWTANTYRRVEGAIRISAAQGESLPQTIRRLRGTKARQYKDGLFYGTKRDMALVARTSMQHVAVQAKESVWKANDDIITGVEWASVLDKRTSTICRSLDGQVFKIDEGPRPPAHIACRSTTVPQVRDSLKALTEGDRFSRGPDGKVKYVSPGTDYYDWLKQQPAAFQDSVIGPERGKLFRDGGLSPDRFAALQLDRNYKPLTLDEMRELEPAAFARAFGGDDGPSGGARQSFVRRAFVAPKTVKEAEEFWTSNGLSDRADLKGLSVKSIGDSFSAPLEVQDRFGVGALDGVGPLSRFGVKKNPRGVSAAIVNITNRASGERRTILHLPTAFGNSEKRVRLHEAARTAAKGEHAQQKKAVLERSRFISDDAKKVAERVPEGEWGWSIPAMADPDVAARLTLFHEYGHVLEDDPVAGPLLRDFVANNNPVNSGWHYALSKYSGTNNSEYIAEAFALYMGGKKGDHFRIHPELLSIFRQLDRAND